MANFSRMTADPQLRFWRTAYDVLTEDARTSSTDAITVASNISQFLEPAQNFRSCTSFAHEHADTNLRLIILLSFIATLVTTRGKSSMSNYNKIRPYTAVSLIILFVFMASTGVILFLAPHGPGSGQWELFGVGKHDYHNIHLVLGVSTFALVLLHAFLNFKPLAGYFKGKQGSSWQHPALYAFVLVVCSFAIGLLF